MPAVTPAACASCCPRPRRCSAFPKRIPIDEEAEVDPGSAYGESKLMVERGLALGRPGAWAAQRLPALFQCRRRRSGRPDRRGPRPRDPSDPAGDRRGARPPAAADRSSAPTTRRRTAPASATMSMSPTWPMRISRVLEPAGSEGACRYNLGNGTGYSVREVIDAVERIGGRPVPHRDRGPRGPAIRRCWWPRPSSWPRETGWRPRLAEIDAVVETAWRWRERHPGGFGGERAKHSRRDGGVSISQQAPSVRKGTGPGPADGVPNQGHHSSPLPPGGRPGCAFRCIVELANGRHLGP